MARPLKIVLGLLVGLVLVLVTALTAAALLFDPQKLREPLIEAVKDQTGRDLAIGSLDLTVFPWLQVRLDDLRLSNAEGFGAEPFAEVGHAEVGVQLLPLLADRQVRVSQVALHGLQVRLARLADGRDNWSDLQKPAEEPAGEPAPAAEGGEPFTLDIAGVEIREAALSYRDAVSGQTIELDNLRLETGALSPGEPVDLEAGFQLRREARGSTPLEATLALAGRLTLPEAGQPLQLDLSTLTLDSQQAALKARLSASAGLSLDPASGRATLRALSATLDAEGKGLPGGRQQLSLASPELVYHLREGRLEPTTLQLEGAGLALSTGLQGSGLAGETPQLSGELSLQPFSPRSLLKALGQPEPATRDARALSEAGLSSRWSASARTLSLENLRLQLDQSTLTGKLSVEDFAAPRSRFDLQLDRLDADRYRPPAAAADATAKQGAGGGDATELPVQALEALKASGSLRVGELVLNGATLKDVRLSLDGLQSAKRIDLAAQLYGGSSRIDTVITPGGTPQYRLATDLKTLQLQPLLKDFAGYDKLSGLGTIRLDLASRGKTVGEVRRGLSGEVALNFENGAIQGFNLGQILRRARATLRGEAAPAAEPEQTDFALISFAGQIRDGVLRSNQLDGRSPLFRVAGEGEINLVDLSLNYLAKPTVVGTSKGQGGRDLEELNGLTIPIRLSGSLLKPAYKLDLESALRQKATEKLRGELKGKEDELKQKLNEKLGDALQGLFGKRKPAEPAPAEPAGEEPAPAP
ncbi:MAG TPA: AsmA family protein [Nevskiaceae bacterium]|nr:AsmA family protein [Nevskiaceae bacterium]